MPALADGTTDIVADRIAAAVQTFAAVTLTAGRGRDRGALAVDLEFAPNASALIEIVFERLTKGRAIWEEVTRVSYVGLTAAALARRQTDLDAQSAAAGVTAGTIRPAYGFLLPVVNEAGDRVRLRVSTCIGAWTLSARVSH